MWRTPEHDACWAAAPPLVCVLTGSFFLLRTAAVSFAGPNTACFDTDKKRHFVHTTRLWLDLEILMRETIEMIE